MGGGGGGGGSGGGGGLGGNGGPDFTLSAGGQLGSGGGGGGSGGGGSGGGGGAYGAGGGGTESGTAGVGTQGFIAITWTPSVYSPTFTLDRWFVGTEQTAANLILYQETDAPIGYGTSAVFQRPSGNAIADMEYFGQTVLSSDAVRYQNSGATLSFWARAGGGYSAAGSLLTVKVVSGSGKDEGATALLKGAWTNATSVISAAPALSAGWSQYTFSGTFGPLVQEIGVLFGVLPTGTAGANDWVAFSGVSILPSGAAVPTNFPPYALDLYEAQRTAVAAYVFVPAATSNCLSLHMRATPSVTGGGSGFGIGGTTPNNLVCSQTSGAFQPLILSADP
jgi:hypothetical protein